MFVLQSTYDLAVRKVANLLGELYREKVKRAELLEKWDDLVETVNAKGGQEFLDRGVLLDDEDLRKLIQLCHPDRHDGKPLAVEMTQKLNGLRAKK